MKIGVSMWSYVRAYKDGRLDIPGFIHEAKRAGADGVELLDFFYREVVSDRHDAMQALRETGLPCQIFSITQNFAKPTEEERRAELDKIKFGVDEAVHYDSEVVRVFAGDVSDGISFQQARDWIVEGLAEASKYADSKGKRLALPNSRILIHQPLGGVSGQATDIEIHAKEILRMREMLNGILVRHMGQEFDRISRDTDRDYIMTADQALEYGLVDQVIRERS